MKKIIKAIKEKMNTKDILLGEEIFSERQCHILSESKGSVEFFIEKSHKEEVEYTIAITYDEDEIIGFTPKVKNKILPFDAYSYACLLTYEQELAVLNQEEKTEHKKYTKEGMIRRVLNERRVKADKSDYQIKWADNIYGDHIITNEFASSYKVFLRDFEKETGYSDSWDSKLNKLGTTKHIMYVFNALKKNKTLFNKLDKTYPFVEIYCDPLNEYKITWYYPHDLSKEEHDLINSYFKNKNFIENDETTIKSFLGFIDEAEKYDHICIRPEVREKVESAYEKALLAELKKDYKPDYSLINAVLFPYQKEGIEFALFKKVAIIADEMGLGKTLQAISIAVLKKQIFDFKKTLIVCPATLKSQWKKEIEKFTNEKVLIVNGLPKEREKQYKEDNYTFFIVNYETILRDSLAINKAGIDFLILDEAQKVKNYETKTSGAIKRLEAKHTLIITGTPIENRLIDIFSVVSVLDPYFFGPLWEFSYEHCLFDSEKPNKINGYYNLQSLNKKIAEILIRREKRNVLKELPNVLQVDIPVELSSLQAEYHVSAARGIAMIIRKKFLTPYDNQRLQMLLTTMRMVCDSTYLVDEETNVSPKLLKLKEILFEEFDLKNTNRKIIIFSEWIKVHKLIGQVLRENNIGFAELNGSVPVKARGELIKTFENNPDCKIFLSTEAGGAGLNLQIADTLINFELPWNPAKKNQRIGRIDRLGQKNSNLTIYNLITENSIEKQIAAGLLIKQNLFEGVLNANSTTDYVDFSAKGRSQFIEQLEAFIKQTQNEILDTEELPKLKEEPTDEEINLSADEEEANVQIDSNENIEQNKEETKTEEFEQVMTNGMQFLAGLYKMSTGKESGIENGQIKIDKETGEVTMSFKLPM